MLLVFFLLVVGVLSNAGEIGPEQALASAALSSIQGRHGCAYEETKTGSRRLPTKLGLVVVDAFQPR